MWADSSQKNYTGTLLNLFKGKKKIIKMPQATAVFFLLHHARIPSSFPCDQENGALLPAGLPCDSTCT